MRKLIIFQIFVIIVLMITTICGLVGCKKYKSEINKLNEQIEHVNNDLFLYKSANKELENKIKLFEDKSPKNPIDTREQRCISKDYSTAGMNNCVYKATKEWHQEINNNILLLKNNMSEEQYKLLIDSQNKWQQYEEAQRVLLNATIGIKVGSIYTNILAGVKNEIVKRRAEDLFEIYDFLTDYSVSTFFNK